MKNSKKIVQEMQKLISSFIDNWNECLLNIYAFKKSFKTKDSYAKISEKTNEAERDIKIAISRCQYTTNILENNKDNATYEDVLEIALRHTLELSDINERVQNKLQSILKSID